MYLDNRNQLFYRSSEPLSFVRNVSQIGTRICSFLFGKKVGKDDFGNTYFVSRLPPLKPYGGKVRQKRWVLYSKSPEPTKIPPNWFLWMHYTIDTAGVNTSENVDNSIIRYRFSPNETGTEFAYSPSKTKQPSENAAAWKP
ncbi:MAG: NADH-ubiquinone oxidoreductase subunit NDUFA12 family protein [Alphaproteobacteria bacterium]|nr:NADH-ubiquinone oxidoreductase subunit NDUFA12 family protein [Alphaproteobacteria bacterium]MCL2505777.1 NADH-ubiquinone oxidoreductase subunit NDUFA12 family protein [Alphaproteobacteria bacterium]